ncbi:MAG: hypothetical protein K2W82_04935 [Candidatus Obscuribacterales bacterium]|nr:hypothetical protein [Candidatus Obscuribacterales bacterium]
MDFIPTEDGSLTLLDQETGELYHNRAGAYTEARENYFLPSAALERLGKNQSLRLLDVCFGLGYNSFVLIEECLSQPGLSGQITIDGIEIDQRLLGLYKHVISDSRLSKTQMFFQEAEQIADASWRLKQKDLTLELNVFTACLKERVPKLAGSYDLIFHDPFSPNRAPEFWTIDLFAHYKRLLANRPGALFTYSAAVAVRQSFAELGFKIGRTKAVGRKSGGGTVATLEPELVLSDYIQELLPEERARLLTASSVPYRDPDFVFSRAEILQARQIEQEQFKSKSKS